MGNHQLPMNNAHARVVQGDVGFDLLKESAAPYVQRHRLTVGRPAPLPCFAGQFGIHDLGEGQTVHQSRIEPETEFETSFVARAGLIVTIVLEGKIEFSLDGAPYAFEAKTTPIAVAWVNQRPTQVQRRTRRNDHLVKVQVHTPLSFLDADWLAGSAGFTGQHAQVLTWQPCVGVTEIARQLIAGKLSPLRTRMASARFSAEALDSLLVHLEARQTPGETQRLAAARAYVEHTASQKPGLAQIASATGFSVSALQRAYRVAYGMTVIEHQRHILLDMAMAALQAGQTTVAQASDIAGYRNPTNFAAAFVKHFGIRPSQVRD